jgi:amino acid adenylation domain-containing protein
MADPARSHTQTSRCPEHLANLPAPFRQAPLSREQASNSLKGAGPHPSAEQIQSIHHRFEVQVRDNPDAVAVVFGQDQLTYKNLNALANQLARYLQDLGIGPEVPVGVYLERSPHRIISLLAILKVGGVYLPLDPTLPPERLAFMVEDAAAPVIITQGTLADKLTTETAKIINLDQDLDQVKHQNSDDLRNSVSGQNLAYIIYTSGSTGRPKGVLVEHQALASHCQTIVEHYQLEAHDRVLQFAAVGFDVSLEQILPPLIAGAAVIIPPHRTLESLEFHRLLHEFEVTVANLPPLFWSQWLTVFKTPASAAVLPNLRLIICGGEAMSPQSLKVWQHSPLRSIRLLNAYGPTETTITAMTFEVPADNTFTQIPIGRPLPNRDVYILDAAQQPVSDGIPGELHIGGAGLARGYLNQPELSKEKFIPNPFITSKKAPSNIHLYRTGDLARYLPDGNIEFLGRIDHQVKIRGFRIELGEIEAALQQHPQVQAAVVAVHEAHGDQRLAAYVVPPAQQNAPDLQPTAADLRHALQTKLPDYMVPSAFVWLKALPLTANGKLDRRALPLPNWGERTIDGVLTPPSTATEIDLASIWCELLKLNQVGIHDDFFALGGHSLLATQAVSRIREVLAVEIPLRTFFEFPTVAQLGRCIEQQVKASATLTIQPIPRTEDLRLSFAQQRLWFLDQLEGPSKGQSALYNIAIAFELTGKLDVIALKQAMVAITQRHEVLRTTFSALDGIPVQVITPETHLQLPVIDLQAVPEEQRRIEVQQRVTAISHQPFDLSHDIPIRSQLLKLAPDAHVLSVVIHHIAADGWSMNILIAELSTLYRDFSQGEPASLSPLPIQYADFAHWQRQWLSEDTLEQQLGYWQQQLAGVPPLLSLPTDHPRPPMQTFRGGRVTFQLDADLSQQLQVLSRQSGTTLFITLLTALSVLLYRYSQSEDIVIGSPIANRNRRAIEPLIGFFANTLPLRINLKENPSFLALLQRARQVALDAYTHQDVPFEKLVEALQPERNLSYSPLFQVMFVLQNAAETLALPHIQSTPLPLKDVTAKFDLTLSIQETAQGLAGFWEYSSDLFDVGTIHRLQGHFHTLLQGIVTDPKQSIATLPLLTAVERQQLLIDWNQTGSDYPRGCIHQRFEAQVEQTPNAIAVVFKDEQLTYQELNCRANQLAHYLQTLGVGPGTFIGLCLERSIELIVGWLGILKAGGAYVPLDPKYPTERLAYILADAAVSLVLTQQSLVETLPNYAGQWICVDAESTSIDQESQANPDISLDSQSLAYVIYTSGSTGKPKGVLVAHQGVCNLAWAQRSLFEVQAGSHILQFASLSFDASVWEIVMALGSGATLCLATAAALMPGDDLQQTLNRYSITHVTLPPSALTGMAPEKLPHLAHVIVAGEACAPNLVARWGKNRRFYNAYGPTESTVCATVTQVSDPSCPPPIGRPIANTRLYVLDQCGQPVPVGVPGELYIGGDGIAKGYWHRPDLTQERFIADPFSPEPRARLYKSGDLVRYLSDGNLEFLGRIDHQVKLRGFRIELGEVEAAIAQQPEAKEAAVLVRTDQGDKRLVAYLVLKPGATLPISTLRRRLKAQLPDYMVPSAFFRLETLPLTPNGKVDRQALPFPTATRAADTEFIAPRTATEVQLSQIWGDLLQLPQVGIDDNFFELGGHSLLATQVISRIGETFAVDLSLRTFFEAPTVAELGRHIDQQETSARVAIAPISRQQALPLSFAQQRLWFLDQLEGQSATYHISNGFQLTGDLNVSALTQAISTIIQRHEVLRTHIQLIAGEPVQVIAPAEPVTLAVVDLQADPVAQPSAVQHYATEIASTPFNLKCDRPIRVQLLKLASDRHILLVTLHHIAADGWSMDLFNRELSVLYGNFCQGQPSSLPPLAIQYADFAHWQRQWLQGEVLAHQLRYWQQQLAGAPALLSLPTDHPRPPRQTFCGRTVQFLLAPALSQQLQRLSQQSETTLFITLLTAFAVLLHRYSQAEDIVIGSPIANRNRHETESLIGCFVNTLPLRTDLKGNPRFSDLLQRVRQVALAAYNHQDLPFEKLVEELKPERNLSYPPLFQVMFAFQNTPVEVPALSGLDLTPLPLAQVTAKFDLTLSMQATEQGLTGIWEYNSDLFDGGTIQRLQGHFQTLLQGIVATPEQQIAALPLLTAAERQQLLIDWNQAGTDVPKTECIHTRFEAQVKRTPDAIALVFEDQQLTYHALNTHANQLAQRLQKQGVGPEQHVGIYIERSPEMVIALLAILKAGGAYIPLDPAYPPARLAFMLEDANIEFLLTQSHLLPQLPTAPAQVICLDRDGTNNAFDEAIHFSPSPVDPNNLAYVIYTSGSTGNPKGVLIPHRNVINVLQAIAQQLNLTAQDTVLSVTTLSFDIAVAEIFLPLTIGAKLVIVSRAVATDGFQLLQAMKTHQPTFMQPTPVTWRMLLAAGWSGSPQLKMVSTGEALPQDLARQLLPLGKELWNLYGPTETTIWSASCRIESAQQPISIGGAIANTQLYVLDRTMQPVPIGVPGELHIGGAGLARGYLNRADLTTAKFVPNPFSADPKARLYKTGDLVRWQPHGQVECLGRIDHQVKIRGFRIELGEIEAALGKHADIKAAIVIADSSESGNQRLVAYLVTTAPLSTREIRAFLNSELPTYMVPSAFVMVEAFPLTPNGKVDRSALPMSHPTHWAGSSEGDTPQDLLDLQLLQICRRVLGHPHIDLLDNFFEVGGNSLLAVRFCVEIENILQRPLPVSALFKAQTIQALAEQLRRSSTIPPSALVMLQAKGVKPPLFFINSTKQAKFLSAFMGSEQPMYGLNIFGVRSLLENSAESSTLIKEIAQQFVQDLLTVQPVGPYQLMGYCQDGPLTLEIAQQLQQQGKAVALLCLVDCLLKPYQPKFWHYLYNIRAFGWPYLMERGQSLLPLQRNQGAHRWRTDPKQRRQTDANTAGPSTPESNALEADVRVKTLEDMKKDQSFYGEYLNQIEQYSPQPYAGKITLLLSTQWRFEDMSLLRRIATQGLTIHSINGLHNRLFKVPLIHDLAQILQGCLVAGNEEK